jgi:hypothetical protein
MTHYIGIDPSIISTGMVIDGKVFNYCRESAALTKKNKYTKWFDVMKDVITYRYITIENDGNYSESEIAKMISYDKITTMIIEDINKHIKYDNVCIYLEGYSYSSSAGDIIDLVTFSTLLRRKLLTISTNITILAPSTLKLETCKLTYQPIEKHIGGKNPRTEYIWKNTIGISGGSFTKLDMFDAILENKDIVIDDHPYIKTLHENKVSIGFTKNIKKPIEDCNDAYLLYLIALKYNS